MRRCSFGIIGLEHCRVYSSPQRLFVIVRRRENNIVAVLGTQRLEFRLEQDEANRHGGETPHFRLFVYHFM